MRLVYMICRKVTYGIDQYPHTVDCFIAHLKHHYGQHFRHNSPKSTPERRCRVCSRLPSICSYSRSSTSPQAMRRGVSTHQHPRSTTPHRRTRGLDKVYARLFRRAHPPSRRASHQVSFPRRVGQVYSCQVPQITVPLRQHRRDDVHSFQGRHTLPS